MAQTPQIEDKTKFNIKLDYKYSDANSVSSAFFDASKKADLQAAAVVWENLLSGYNKFTLIPTGKEIKVIDPLTSTFLTLIGTLIGRTL
jgi:hypothetical protein